LKTGANIMADIDVAAETAELTRDEGVRLFVYDDATGLPIRPGTIVRGHPTLGIGRALDVEGITAAEASFLLADDETAGNAALSQALPWFQALDPLRQRVLAEMAFNMGINGLLGFHDTLAAVQSSNWQMAHDGMLASHWAQQVGGRAQRLATMMLTGESQ
jgi:lysozyme